ncbi:MAG: hypothetical protein KBD26_00765 [Candidatus Pacebacteria bacterium]|nr:hypothetical protein [Candidatus Paceibacterota bacterium]MBP9772342.1 hypothetical protein [Candidatus Paceibacterota bacterium]
MKIAKVLLLTGIISFALCSCTKEEVVLTGDYVSPVGSAKVELTDLSGGKVYGYLENQNGEEFMAEFFVPDTLIEKLHEFIYSGKEFKANYIAIDQAYVEDESGFFSEEQDMVLAEGNLEVSYFEIME